MYSLPYRVQRWQRKYACRLLGQNPVNLVTLVERAAEPSKKPTKPSKPSKPSREELGVKCCGSFLFYWKWGEYVVCNTHNKDRARFTDTPNCSQRKQMRRVKGEWILETPRFTALPPDWAVIEARQRPEPWLNNPNLHALRQMALMADTRAVRLLLSLQGQDREKEQQILTDQNETAQHAIAAAQSALAYLRAPATLS